MLFVHETHENPMQPGRIVRVVIAQGGDAVGPSESFYWGPALAPDGAGRIVAFEPLVSLPEDIPPGDTH